MLKKSAIPTGKIEWRNLPPAGREAVRYHANFTGANQSFVWLLGGLRCFNEAIKSITLSPRAATHIARLDEDDTWHTNHLQILAFAYVQVPGAGFAYTRS